jgi:phosphate transport system ATP-binding protein
MITWVRMQAEVAAREEPESDIEIKIDARQVNFFYGDFQALHEASLAVQSRKITALIGPSGCGKTTFLRIFNRMHDLTPGTRATGEVLLDGRNVLSPDTDVINLRRQVGMLFQRANPFPKSIFDNVAYGPHMLGWSKQRISEVVEESLKDTGLWEEVKDRLRRSALNLSGGQQQRLCLARALAVKPDVILMDEPASALDPIATLRIEELMQELKKRYTIVIVTHNMQQAARVSDFTAFMLMNPKRAGEVIEFGPTDDIFNRPKDSRTEDYITGRFG